MTTHINQLHAILEQLSTYDVSITKIKQLPSGCSLRPSDVFNTADYEEIEFFDLIIIESTYVLLQTKKTKCLKIKTNNLFDYNDFDARGYITVSDGTDFSIADAIVGTTSSATGTVYKIDGNTLYLKTITGTWQVESINGKTATCTSAQVVILFPFYIWNTLVDYSPDIDISELVGGKFAAWIRFEARWAL